MAQMRLNKIIADAGITSRRGADELIESGRVSVNGLPFVKWAANLTLTKFKSWLMVRQSSVL